MIPCKKGSIWSTPTFFDFLPSTRVAQPASVRSQGKRILPAQTSHAKRQLSYDDWWDLIETCPNPSCGKKPFLLQPLLKHEQNTRKNHAEDRETSDVFPCVCWGTDI